MKKLTIYLPFAALFLLTLLFYPFIDTSGWRSNSDIHAMIEFASSLLAVTAGIMVLLHFLNTGRSFFLIISIGFVLIGAEEFIHAIFSLNRIWLVIPPTLKLAISTTWLTGQFTLLSSFFIALLIGKREIVSAKRRQIAVVYNLIGFICAVSVALLIFNSTFLPDFVQLGSFTKKLIELSFALLYFVVFLFYSNIYIKQQSRSPLLWSITACIIVRVLAHIFVFDAHDFYDAHWDIAHLLVFLSYFPPIFGIWGETLKLQKSAKEQVIQLAKEISERKHAEEQIKTILRTTIDGFYLVDTEGRILETNDSYCSMIGYTREELLKINVKDIDAVDTEEVINNRIQRILEIGYDHFETKHLCKDGRIIDIEASVNFLTEDQPKLFCFMRDITERKQAEAKLLAEHAFRNSIELSLSSGIVIVNDEGRQTYVNPSFCKLFGWSEGELMGKTAPFVYWPTDQLQSINEAFQLTLANKAPKKGFELEFVRKDGVRIPAQVIITPFSDGKQRTGWMANVIDITERKLAEKALLESKEHLEIRVKERTAELERTNSELHKQIAERKTAEDTVKWERQRFYDVLEKLPVYVILLSTDYHVSFANRFFRQRFGESGGLHCYEYLFHRDAPCEICKSYTVLKTNAPHRWDWTGPDDRNYDIFDFPFTDEDGNPLILEMGIDITERKQAEEELQEAHDKLEQRVIERTEELNWANKKLQTDIIKLEQAEEAIRNLARFPTENPDPVLRVDRSGRILFTNEASDKLLNWKLQIGQKTPSVLQKIITESLNEGIRKIIDVENNQRVISFSVIPIMEAGYANLYGRDITEHMLAEEQVKRSDYLRNTLLDNLPFIALVLKKHTREIVSSNKLAAEAGAVIGKTCYETLTHCQHHCPFCKAPDLWETGKKQQVEAEYIGRHWEGRWMPLSDDLYVHYILDITEHKHAIEEIKNMKESLEKLNHRLDEIRENERALISREIHDQLGQSLTALKIDLNWLSGKITSDSEESAKLKGMIDLVTGTIRDVQRISSELRPPILDDLGLAAALEWYCEEFAKRTGLQVHMELEDVQAENMSKNLTIYRVLQESLTNIIRHAGAKKVQVKLCEIKNDIVLIIQDDGTGISPDLIKSSKSLGLLGMFERVKQSGGHLKITIPDTGGTDIRIYIPIQ